ncbi:hypothetical protein X943_002686 [Babesia divergens]|uniref:Uncharacterized protein n=1 Tax=Babesia divergens TaxID=32595 RepID=A0AAD9GHN9_BABDI|nr:hypothetical protein X943_002686 [Babesia divergens]
MYHAAACATNTSLRIYVSCLDVGMYITETGPGCPLCRCNIPHNGVVDLKFECGEYNSVNQTVIDDGCHASDITAEDISQKELEDLRHRLAQAVTDKLDLQERCISIEKENTTLQETLLHVQDSNVELENENKDLKLAVAANKASIAKLTDLVDKQKSKLAKLDLNVEDNNDDGFNTYLKNLSPAERFALLTNRVAELEGINKTLTSLRDVWKKKCEKLSRDYLILERYSMRVRAEPGAAQKFLPDPLSDTPAVKSSEQTGENDTDLPRKVPRSIDFGFIKSAGISATHTPTRVVQPATLGFPSQWKTGKASKAKPQSIEKFFKSQ